MCLPTIGFVEGAAHDFLCPTQRRAWGWRGRMGFWPELGHEAVDHPEEAVRLEARRHPQARSCLVKQRRGLDVTVPDDGPNVDDSSSGAQKRRESPVETVR